MKIIRGLFFVICLIFVVCTSVQAAPQTGTWGSLDSGFEAGEWSETFAGGGEETPGNIFSIQGNAFTLDGAILDSVTVSQNGSLEKIYLNGVFSLNNADPWGNADDPAAAFVFPEILVTVIKGFDGEGSLSSINFDLTAQGECQGYPGYLLQFSANYEGLPGFDPDGPMIFGELNEAVITISGPVVDTMVIDIKPGSCRNPVNVKSKGVLTVAILGTEDFDVNDIDPVSLRLIGISPLRSSFEDIAAPLNDEENSCDEMAADGYMDMVLKFSTAEVVQVLSGEDIEDGDIRDGDLVVITLTGTLIDGTAVEGSDAIMIIDKTDNGNTHSGQERNVNKGGGKQKDTKKK